MTPIERRFDAIYQIGCLACRTRGWYGIQCQAHHLNLGGKAGQKRRGNKFVIGLCPWHHVGEIPEGREEWWMLGRFGPSYKLQSRKFRAEFGTDDELLAYQNKLIDELRAAA